MPITEPDFDFSGGTITIKIYPGYPNSMDSSDEVQTITMDFPLVEQLPLPNIHYSATYIEADGKTKVSSHNDFAEIDARFAYKAGTQGGRGINEGGKHNPLPYIAAGGHPSYRGDVVRSVQARYLGPALGDYRVIAGLANVPDDVFEGHGLKDPPTDGLSYADTTGKSKLMHSMRVYVSVGNEQTSKKNGFYANWNNDTGMTYVSPNPRAHAKLVDEANVLDPIASGGARPSRAPVAPQGMKGAYMDAAGTIPGDWDNGPGQQIDGPYINKPDEGNSNIGYYNTGANTTGDVIVETGASFAPNRQVSSAVAFGSLPTGIDPSNIDNTQPWKTLLFGKNPAAGAVHPGFGIPLDGPPYDIPPDHAFLDFFTMPIVEPYAISEPFSTAGKVNMNYQIAPFTYLTRNTGIRAALKSTMMMAIPTADGRNYKAAVRVDFDLTPPPDYRYTLNLDETVGTLKGFEERFGDGDIFRSATEFCDITLVPEFLVNTENPAPGNPTYDTMESWWENYKLTGDNVREGPYGHIYPRLTTKSNTYTVHVRSQSLKKVPGTAADEFVEDRDLVTGEFRGSFVVERYLDPNSDSLIDASGQPASETDPNAMVGPYKYRVLSSKRF
jgi:uncharacterized protein (TIGR02600 family)